VSPIAPVPERRHLGRGGVLLALLLAAVLATGLVVATTSGGRQAPPPSFRVVGQPAPGPFSNAAHGLPAAAVQAARTFFAGYLAYLYGHGTASQIRDASTQLTAKLPKGPLSISPAGRRLHPRVVRLGAREAAGPALHVTALIGDGIARYPIRTVMAHERGGWETTQLVSPE